MNNNLKYSFYGFDYDQTLDLHSFGFNVFNGVADDLVTSANGDLQVRLNYNGDIGYLHNLRIANDVVVFVPVVSDVEVEGYLRSTNSFVLICPLDELKELWSALRYEPYELEELKEANQNDWFLLWLISSGTKSLMSLSIESLVDSLLKNIIAESVDGSPSVQEVIQSLRKGSKTLELIDSSNFSFNETITVFIDEDSGETIEWNALDTKRAHCLINSNYLLKIT
ncbi:hypothetical protein [Pseudoalteromonas sp. PPB1]|uniref:hypothetical protein n=1 Tax=Pseudoalteromonas sp. PPB1 TaxID=2756136 RepID=UPI00189174DC|nr:hypothetical protein [Pseudoalteromonas sp. PPB1]